MATETAEAELKTEVKEVTRQAEGEGKVFDLQKGWITPEKPTNGEEPKKEEPKKEEPKAEEAKTEPKTEPKTESKTEEPKKEEAKIPDFASHLKEKYQIDSEDELQKILDANVKLGEQLEEAKKPKEPTWKSETQKKIVAWLDEKGYNLDSLGEGLETSGVLMNLQVDKIDERKALEEAYIIENTDITREEAKKLFARDFKKYTLKKEDFDEDKDYAEAQELADIQRKKDVAKAKKVLTAEQEKLKVAAKEEKKAEPKVEIPTEAIESYTKEVNKVFDNPKTGKFDRIIFEDEKDPTIKVSIVIPEDKLKMVRQMATDYVKRTDIYDDKKKIPNFDPAAHIKQVINALYGDWLYEQVFRETLTLAKTLRAEQLAGVKPDKKGGGDGKTAIPSIEEQFLEHAKKAKESRAKGK